MDAGNFFREPPKEPVQILDDVTARLTDGEHWTAGALARTDDGLRCTVFHPRATCWCLDGAITVATGGACSAQAGVVREALRRSARRLFGIGDFIIVQDTHGHAAALAMLADARAALAAAGAS